MKLSFTILELLLTITLISLMIALLLPAIAKATHSAKKTVCKVSYNQYAVDFGNYGNKIIIIPPEANCFDCHASKP